MELDKVLVALSQQEGIGKSARLDSLYWNVMRWLNYTYVCLALWLLGFLAADCLSCFYSLMWGGRKTNQGTSLPGTLCQDLQPLTVIFGILGAWIPSHICLEALKAGKHSVNTPVLNGIWI